jgi:hypothetical protein
VGPLLFTHWSHSPISGQSLGPLFFKYQSCSAVPSQHIPYCSHTDLIHLFQWVPYCSHTDLFTSSHSVNGILYCPHAPVVSQSFLYCSHTDHICQFAFCHWVLYQSHTGLGHQFPVIYGFWHIHIMVFFTSCQSVSGICDVHILVLFISCQSVSAFSDVYTVPSQLVGSVIFTYWSCLPIPSQSTNLLLYTYQSFSLTPVLVGIVDIRILNWTRIYYVEFILLRNDVTQCNHMTNCIVYI